MELDARCGGPGRRRAARPRWRPAASAPGGQVKASSCQSSQGPAGTPRRVGGVEEAPADLGTGGPGHRAAQDLGEELAPEADAEHRHAVVDGAGPPGRRSGAIQGTGSSVTDSIEPITTRRSNDPASGSDAGPWSARWADTSSPSPRRRRRGRRARRWRCAGGRRCGGPRSPSCPVGPGAEATAVGRSGPTGGGRSADLPSRRERSASSGHFSRASFR